MRFYLLVICLLKMGFLSSEPLKILHLTFHRGCANDIEAVCKKLSLDLTTWYIHDLPPGFFDEQSKGSGIYNIGHDRAERVWDRHRAYFESFDVVLTSDTAPLSRIFLQNGWTKPLIIWVCNRFDYCDEASLDCEFPDKEYYRLLSQAAKEKNVAIVGYTEFEHTYAQSKGVYWDRLTIRPSGAHLGQMTQSAVPQEVKKSETFFLPPYGNETVYMNLSRHCTKLEIKNFCGRYRGPQDLKDFKGIIHIPYAWSNLALFENLHLGIPYFIPSKVLMLRLIEKGAHFQDRSFTKEQLALSEWYSGQYSPLIVYFDSWKDLVAKTRSYDYESNREKILHLAKKHEEEVFSAWQAIFNRFIQPPREI